MASKKCTLRVKAYFADPHSSEGYGTVEGTIPCDKIEWWSDRDPVGFVPTPTDIYQLKLNLCHNGDCRDVIVDLDTPRGPFKRRR